MQPERWQRIGEILHQALELAPGERAAWIAGACGGDADLQREVSSLLSADEKAAVFLAQPLLAASALAAQEEPSLSWVGRTLGPYRLLRLIGEGGMSGRKTALRQLIWMRDSLCPGRRSWPHPYLLG